MLARGQRERKREQWDEMLRLEASVREALCRRRDQPSRGERDCGGFGHPTASREEKQRDRRKRERENLRDDQRLGTWPQATTGASESTNH